MTNTTEQNAAPVIYDAGSGYHFIVAKVGGGAFQVFARDPEYCGGAFYAWHGDRIRREGAEALAQWLAEGMREHLAEVAKAATAEEREYAGAATGMSFDQGHADRIAQDFDAAAALLPYLGHAPDSWELAVKIAKARPWEGHIDLAFLDDLPF